MRPSPPLPPISPNPSLVHTQAAVHVAYALAPKPLTLPQPSPQLCPVPHVHPTTRCTHAGRGARSLSPLPLPGPKPSPDLTPQTLTGHVQVAVHVAKAVAQKAYEGGYATALPKPHNLYDQARVMMYNPQYRRYR